MSVRVVVLVSVRMHVCACVRACMYGMCGMYGMYGMYGIYGMYGMYGIYRM